MAIKLPSASKLSLAERCAYPWTSGIRWPDDPPGPAALFGQAVHRCAERYAMGDSYSVEAVATEFGVEKELERLRLADVDVREQLDRDRFTWREAEVPIALDPIADTARRAKDRFDKKPGEMMLIVDLVMHDEAHGFTVRDWKATRVKPINAAEAPQIRACAYAAAKVFGESEVNGELAYVNGGVYVNRGVIDSLELELIGAGLAALFRGLPDRTVPTPGEWCRSEWCSLRDVCEVSQGKTRKRKVAA